jgi:hypothetical protein
MPPAFNLSQDQTLQFNLDNFMADPRGPTDLTQGVSISFLDQV